MNDQKSPARYRGFDTYTTQDHHAFVKENFKRLAEILQDRIRSGELPEYARVLDVGCATGALIAYLATMFPSFSFVGIDISDELIEIAREKVPNATFEVGSGLSLGTSHSRAYDLVLSVGVIGIFDYEEAQESLNKLIDCARPNGLVYVFHQFNEFDVDVQVKHRRCEFGPARDGWGAGWNIYSYRTIGHWLSGGRATAHRFIDFEMPISLQPQENPVRTWTIDMADGRRRLTNGLKLLVDLRFLEIRV
jgi:SAM-dependent methyltransferase